MTVTNLWQIEYNLFKSYVLGKQIFSLKIGLEFLFFDHCQCLHFSIHLMYDVKVKLLLLYNYALYAIFHVVTGVAIGCIELGESS